MSTFKEQLGEDLDVFINLAEFADDITVDGETVKGVIDSSVVNNFQQTQLSGVFTATIVVYVRQGDLKRLPKIGSLVEINGFSYMCRDVAVEQGVDILTLESNEQ